MATLKEMVAGRVHFAFYRDGELWYRTDVGVFEFPVPVADVGTATFLAEDKGMFFMRWMRKHIAKLEGFRAQGNEVAPEPSDKIEINL
jgi:hypothetical protein